MSSSELRRIYAASDHGIAAASGVLTILHRKILRDLGMRDADILQSLERWLHDPTSNIPQTPKHRTQARGNYIKKMIEPAMSWRSFMDMVQMLYPAKVKISVAFEWPFGKAGTIHNVELDLSYRLNRNPFLFKAGHFDTAELPLQYTGDGELSEAETNLEDDVELEPENSDND